MKIIEEFLCKDLEIDKTIENEVSTKQSIENMEVNTNKENTIYVKFLGSENSVIQDNSVFEFDDANELIKSLNKIHIANKTLGYDKTKFELQFNKECKDKFYTDRFDIG